MATFRASHPAYVAALLTAGFVPVVYSSGRYTLPGATPRAAKSAAHKAFGRAASQTAGEWIGSTCGCCSHWAPASGAGKITSVARHGSEWALTIETSRSDVARRAIEAAIGTDSVIFISQSANLMHPAGWTTRIVIANVGGVS